MREQIKASDMKDEIKYLEQFEIIHTKANSFITEYLRANGLLVYRTLSIMLIDGYPMVFSPRRRHLEDRELFEIADFINEN